MTKLLEILVSITMIFLTLIVIVVFACLLLSALALFDFIFDTDIKNKLVEASNPIRIGKKGQKFKILRHFREKFVQKLEKLDKEPGNGAER